MFDYHIHSTFSPDSTQSLDDICKVAIEKNITEIAITDHMDKKPGFKFDYSNYIDEIEKVRERFKGQVAIVNGVEIGVREDNINKLIDYTQNNKYDFIIASTHYVGNYHLSSQEFIAGKGVNQIYTEYLNNLLNIVRNFNDYSVLGHLDLIVRYVNTNGNSIEYEKYSDLIDEILNLVINNNKGIEINTSSYEYGFDFTMPNAKILKRYNELGGQIITIGSDAHQTKYIGNKFAETNEMLKQLGFKYICRFKDFKPIFEKI